MRAVHAPLARSVAALGLVLVLTGCSSLNPFNWFGGSNEPKPAPLVEIVKPLTVRTIWQARVGSSHGHALTPAIAGGSVYAAAYDGTLARFDEASGKEVWRVDVGNAVSGGVGSDGERVVVGTTEGEVITLDNNGRVMWRARVSSEVLASPAVAGRAWCADPVAAYLVSRRCYQIVTRSSGFSQSSSASDTPKVS